MKRRNSLIIESNCGEVLKEMKKLVRKIATKKKAHKDSEEFDISRGVAKKKGSTESSMTNYFTVRAPNGGN